MRPQDMKDVLSAYLLFAEHGPDVDELATFLCENFDIKAHGDIRQLKMAVPKAKVDQTAMVAVAEHIFAVNWPKHLKRPTNPMLGIIFGLMALTGITCAYANEQLDEELKRRQPKMTASEAAHKIAERLDQRRPTASIEEINEEFERGANLTRLWAKGQALLFADEMEKAGQ